MTILGFSSSGIKAGNVDRMVQALLDKCGKSRAFVNLVDLSYGPCRACVHLCAGDNLCKLDDDLKDLYPQIISAEAIILGTPTYFNSMNGFMAVFLERLWAFRHQRFPLAGKPFAVVSSGDQLQGAEKAVEAVKRCMTSYQARFVGSVSFESAILPCYKCGYGHVCKVGGFYQEYGEEGRRKLKIIPELFKVWEDSPQVISKVEELARNIANLLE